MTLDDTLREAIAYWQGFRRLGFSADDIFIEIGVDALTGLRCAFVLLKTQGKEFRCTAGTVGDATDADVEEQWTKRSQFWNERTTPDENEAIIKDTVARHMGAELILGLKRKGFSLPVVDELEGFLCPKPS